MTLAPGQTGPLRLDELVEHGGIWHRAKEGPASAYRRRWEEEAEEDHVRSAIAGGATADEDWETLTAKVSPIWARVPRGADLGTVLEIGPGYGRIPLYLARERDASWSDYVGVDISAGMLQRLLNYRDRYDVVPDGRVHLICASAEELPVEDDSVDVALSSAVFLHMGKGFVACALGEVARTLKPGGTFLFDVSFPNAFNPPSLLPRLKPRRLRPPNFMKYWRRDEIERLLVESGLAAKAGGYTVEPGSYAMLPKRLGPIAVPLARRANRAAESAPASLQGLVTFLYTAYGPGLLE